MSPERAQSLLKMAKYGEFPYAYPRDYCFQGGIITEGGITKEEDAYIKSVWKTMPGHTTYNNAVWRIARGKV